MKDYSRYSFWLDSVRDDLVPRPPLDRDVDADLAIVGAGYTGLWTAYYLLKADPSLRVVIVEKEIAGFGASGRNGGWCSALFAASRNKIARHYGRDRAIAVQREMFATADEVGRAAAAEGIECDFHKGGTLTLVTAAMQMERVRAELRHQRSWGFERRGLPVARPQRGGGPDRRCRVPRRPVHAALRAAASGKARPWPRPSGWSERGRRSTSRLRRRSSRRDGQPPERSAG